MAHLFDTTPRDHRLPRGAGTFAMWWFLSTLGMLFAASLLGYIIIRLQRAWPNNVDAVEQVAPIPIGSLRGEFPSVLWLSTAIVLAASVTIQLALRAVEREQQNKLRRWTLITLALGVLFCVIQLPAMASLIREHLARMSEAATAAKLGNALLGLAFVLILLHALHVLGGIVHLLNVAHGAKRGLYDHESHGPVKHAAMYWHFLDLVWMLMFATFYIAG
ncbi:MAG: cytochrome c oxidase subunit 3 [Tepidisphaeraceae bacterium]